MEAGENQQQERKIVNTVPDQVSIGENADPTKPKSTLSVMTTAKTPMEQMDSDDMEVVHHLAVHAEIQHHQHRLAGHYFRFRYVWYSLLPSTLLAFVAAMFTLVGQTVLDSDKHKATVYLLVGTFAALSVLFQALSSYSKFGTRADMHKQAASQLEEIQSHMSRRIIGSTFGETARLDVLKFDARIQEALKGCTSNVPMTISTQFEILTARVAMKLKSKGGQPSGEHFNKVATTKARELADKLRRGFVFPFFVPSCADRVIPSVNEWEIPSGKGRQEYSTDGDSGTSEM